MEKDFYLNDRGLAAYFEKDWGDHARPSAFHFAPFNPAHLYSPYHEQSMKLLLGAMESVGARPTKMLEIGASLGRNFFEVCSVVDTLRAATLVEPSKLLYEGQRRIFEGEVKCVFNTLVGLGDFAAVVLDTSPIRATCAEVRVTALNCSFQELELKEEFDLVVCSNVIDQCKDHFELVNLLKERTAPGGILLLSCTYQWQSKYIGNAVREITNINDVFADGGWRWLAEDHIPFHVRANERHWLSFLAHASVFQKI